MELLVLASLLVSIWLWLYAAAGVASYWFHPRRLDVQRQNRAVALSYYACAPLVLTPVTVLLIVFAAVLEMVSIASQAWVPIAHAVALFAASFQFWLWWGVSIVMLRRVTGAGVMRLARMTLALPVAWALLAVWIIGGIVGSAVLIAVVVTTVL
jgi:hypothetical protein